MKRLNACFNMVEIALAMAVLALGVISIMALFPIGLNANRDSMAESYAADSADQFVHQLEDLIRRPNIPTFPGTPKDGWTVYVTSATAGWTIPAIKPPTDDITGTVVLNTDGTMFTGASGGIFKVIRYVDKNGNKSYDTGDILDFEAIIVVWQEAVNVPSATGTTALLNTIAAALNVEISWPARLPYAQRQKSFFKKELFAR